MTFWEGDIKFQYIVDINSYVGIDNDIDVDNDIGVNADIAILIDVDIDVDADIQDINWRNKVSVHQMSFGATL